MTRCHADVLRELPLTHEPALGPFLLAVVMLKQKHGEIVSGF